MAVMTNDDLLLTEGRFSSMGRPHLKFAWGPLLALYSAITFFMLGIDMALLHFGYQHHNLLAILPVVFCAFAAVVSFLTTFSVWLRRNAWVLGMLALLIGGVGTIIHLEIAFAHLTNSKISILIERLVFDPRPPLAPAALAGTGLLLIMITLAEYWPIAWMERWIYNMTDRIPLFHRWVEDNEHSAAGSTK